MALRIYKPIGPVTHPDGTPYTGGGSFTQGDPPQWGDDSDATFAYRIGLGQVPTALLPPVDFTDATHVWTTIRCSRESAGEFIPAGYVGTRLSLNQTGFDFGETVAFGGEDNVSVGPTWIESTHSTIDFLPEAIRASLEAGTGYIKHNEGASLTIYELWLVLEVPDSEPPPPPPSPTAHHGQRVVEFTVGPRPDPVTEQVAVSQTVSAGDPPSGTLEPTSPATDVTGVNLRLTYSATGAGTTLDFSFRNADDTEFMTLTQPIVSDGTDQSLSYDLTAADYTAEGTTQEALLALLEAGAKYQIASTSTLTVTGVYVRVSSEITRTTQPDPDPASLIPRGPDDEVHHGYFLINRVEKSVSAQVQVTSPDPMWLQAWVEFLLWDDTSASFLPVAQRPAGPPKRTADNRWEQINVFEALAGVEASHWRLEVRATAADPRVSAEPPEPGQKFRAECVFVPDNGLPVADEPYLDGDQPGAMWEGEPHNSTSVYGSPPPINLSEIINLDDELTLYSSAQGETNGA